YRKNGRWISLPEFQAIHDQPPGSRCQIGSLIRSVRFHRRNSLKVCTEVLHRCRAIVSGWPITPPVRRENSDPVVVPVTAGDDLQSAIPNPAAACRTAGARAD